MQRLQENIQIILLNGKHDVLFSIPHLATSYNNIGLLSSNMGEYSKALSVYEKALEIDQKSLPPNHSNLLTVQKNIEYITGIM